MAYADESVRRTLGRLKTNWKRAKRWITSPDPQYFLKKGDPDPKALACSGVLWQQGPQNDPVGAQMSLRFVTGRPVSALTTQFLQWCCTRLQAHGKIAGC